MSSISSVGGASSAWPGPPGAARAGMKERMFEKVDADASGGVDKTEFEGLLDHISAKGGKVVGTADDLIGKMDTDGDGSLNSDELDAGMKSLLPPPSSTVDFAQQRSQTGPATVEELVAALDTDGDGSIGLSELEVAVSGGADRQAPAGGMPPAPPVGAGPVSSGASGAATSTEIDPLDTNEDGVVSAQERMTGAVNELIKALDTDGDESVSATEVDSFISRLAADSSAPASPSSTDGASGGASGGNGPAANAERQGEPARVNLAALSDLVREEYARAAENFGSTATVDVTV